MLGQDELKTLADDIRQHGLRDPVVLLDDKILDGRNRALACEMAGVDPFTEARLRLFGSRASDGEDPIGFVVSQNSHRRHLTAAQRAMVAENVAKLRQGFNRFTKVDAHTCASTQTEAAKDLHVSRRAVQQARHINEEAPELADKVRKGELSLRGAERMIQTRKSPRPPTEPAESW